jgi:hypothetical protein
LCIDPLTCIGTSASGPFSVYNLSGAVAPVPAGGVLIDGFYLATTANYYGPRDSVEGGTIEVRSGTVRKSRTVYATTTSSALTGYTFAGSYTLSDKKCRPLLFGWRKAMEAGAATGLHAEEPQSQDAVATQSLNRLEAELSPKPSPKDLARTT